MSVILETSLGDIVIDLFTEECPKSTRNFLKLCKIKYYNNVIFHSIDKDFIAQSGDQSGTGKGGSSIYGQLYGPQSRLFSHEIVSGLNHAKKGTVGYVPGSTELDVPSNGSVFYITMRDGLDYLDGKNTIFGIVAEGFDVLEKLNGAFVDEGSKKPLKNIKIRHTVVLDDPFDDPAGLEVQDLSPEVEFDPLDVDYEEPEEAEFDEEKKIEILKEKEAVGRAQVLEIIGDIPDADIKPPENVLFVCKLNPVTQSEDLMLIFSRFGEIKSCEVIKDWKTGDSLQYAFIEFATQEQCEQAYLKMENVLIDDRRIHVDFSQSVAKLWKDWRRGDRTMLTHSSSGGLYEKEINKSLNNQDRNSYSSSRHLQEPKEKRSSHSRRDYRERSRDRSRRRSRSRSYERDRRRRHRSRSRSRSRSRNRHHRTRDRSRSRDRRRR